MKKLTAKEYLEDLECCSHFIAAVHNRTLKEIISSLDSELFDYSQLKDNAIYKYSKVTKRSKDYVFAKEDGNNSYRNFNGSNNYYTYKQILIHVNVQNDHTTIFLNL